MGKTARIWGAAFAVPLILVLVSCSGDAPSRNKGANSSPGPNGPRLALTITPAAHAKNVPISTEIGTQVGNGKITDVTLLDDKNNKITGNARTDNTSWVPDKPLAYGRTYTATVSAAGEDGTTQTQTTTFSTMARRPAGQVETWLYLLDKGTYGLAMPVVVDFGTEIPEAARASVEKRLFVTTTPPQPGAWAWYNGRQAFYRGPTYWQPGTKITVRSALDGHPMGGNRYGDTDRRATATIGNMKTVVKIDNASKRLAVYQNDKLVKTLPVSLGKPSTPSSSGTMVIMEKRADMIFDTRNDPNPVDRYVVPVQYAQRLTWGGEFIHAAPWSVGDQGRRNVSHGCINLSTANAQWLFSVTKVGDLVIVKGTGQRLDPGNGWTGWDLSWEEHLKRSALPHPELANASPAPSPAPDQNPAGPTQNPAGDAATSPSPPS